MADKREHERSKVEGVTITYDAGAEAIEGTVRDIGRGGFFVMSDKPLALGKRIIFDIKASGGSISGAGRVVWVRQTAEGSDVIERMERPTGMGVKFIDVDDAALVLIDALVAEKRPTAAKQRERTVMGVGASPATAPKEAPKPARERTVMGIGVAMPPPSTTTPNVRPPGAAPPAASPPAASPPRPGAGRERTVMGVGVGAPPRVTEASHSQPEVPDEGWDEVEPDPKAITKPIQVERGRAELPTMAAAIVIPPEAKLPEEPTPEPEPALPEPVAEAKSEPTPEPPKEEPKPEPTKEPPREVASAVAALAPAPKKGSSAGIWIVLILAVVGVVAYLKRDQLMSMLGIAPPPVPTTPAPPTPTPSVSATAPVSASASAPPAASSTPLVALEEAGAPDASRDAAPDAAIDSGKPKPATTTTTAPTAKPKPKPTATATGDDPY